jgi:hypothetical protein
MTSLKNKKVTELGKSQNFQLLVVTMNFSRFVRNDMLYSSRFKIHEADYGSATT